MRAFIENEYLLPCLSMGIPEDVFWQKSPRTIRLYIKAFEMREEREAKRWSQKAWEMGAYVRWAIATSVFPAGLYDGKGRLPNYPNCPYINSENNPEELTEEQKQYERMRCYNYLMSFGKK